MKFLLLTTCLPLLACTESFRAKSSENLKQKGTPTVRVTLNNVESLPLCSGSAEGLTAFLATDGRLYRCQGGNWFAVSTEKKSWTYQARASVRYNQWEDLSTRKRWAIAPTLADLPSSCQSGWRLPKPEELARASENGLFEGIKANGGMAFSRGWSERSIDGKQERVAVRVAPSAKDDEKPGVYCVLDT